MLLNTKTAFKGYAFSAVNNLFLSYTPHENYKNGRMLIKLNYYILQT